MPFVPGGPFNPGSWHEGQGGRFSVGHAAADLIPVSSVHQGAGEDDDGDEAETVGAGAAGAAVEEVIGRVYNGAQRGESAGGRQNVLALEYLLVRAESQEQEQNSKGELQDASI